MLLIKLLSILSSSKSERSARWGMFVRLLLATLSVMVSLRKFVGNTGKTRTMFCNLAAKRKCIKQNKACGRKVPWSTTWQIKKHIFTLIFFVIHHSLTPPSLWSPFMWQEAHRVIFACFSWRTKHFKKWPIDFCLNAWDAWPHSRAS